MSKPAFFKLMRGLLLLGVVMGALYVYVDHANSQKTSAEATVKAPSYKVGVDYTGVVTKQFVRPGDRVEQGQPLFYVKSGVLIDSLHSAKVTPADLLYPLSENNEIIISAPKAGIIKDVFTNLGSFVASGKELAEVTDTSNNYVSSTYRLNKADLVHLDKTTHMEVTLPNGTRLDTKIQDITITDTKNGISLRVDSSLAPESNFRLGTPVSTRLHLVEPDLWQRLSARLHDWYDTVAANVAAWRQR